MWTHKWGQVNSGNYRFRISTGGNFRVTKFDALTDEFVTLIPWSTSDAIKRVGVNTLRVWTSAGVHHFEVNGQAIGEIVDDAFTEGRISVFTIDQSRVAFDNLDLTVTTITSPTLLTKPANHDAEARLSHP